MTSKIQEISDYEKFELLQFNRPVKRTQYLEKSMRKYGWLDAYPMHVVRNNNGKLKIKAGHHRFHVARKLNIPVKYIVDDSDISIRELEQSTSPWTLSDYLISNIREGRHPYAAVQQYHQRTGISLICCISMLGGESAGSQNKMDHFKAGTYQLGDMQNAAMVERIIKFLRDRCNIEWATNSLLVKALSRLCWVPEFDSKRFMQKAKDHRFLFEKRPSVEDYTNLIELIYNRNSQNKMPLTFLADETAKNRNPVKMK